MSGDTSGVLQLATNGTTTALTLDASQRAAFVAGTAALPAITTTGDTNTGIFFPAADTIAFSEGGTESMRIDSSGNVGIGTTTPPTRLGVQLSNATTYTTSTRTNNGIQIYNSSLTTNGYTGIEFVGEPTSGNGGIAGIGSVVTGSGSANLVFGTRDSATYAERMRIDSSGNVLIGTTTSLASGLTVTGGNGPQFSLNTTTRYTQFNFYNSGTQKSYIAWDNTNTNLYVQNSSGGVYLTNTGTSWTSNSDERLKENLVPITDALTKVNTLRAVVGNFIADETKKKTPFLIAQDVKAVLPEAVTSSTLKDDETNTEYFGIAYTEVIPLLVASIKELKAINDTQAETINALTARIVAIESKA
jgi:hypothetical protein